MLFEATGLEITLMWKMVLGFHESWFDLLSFIYLMDLLVLWIHSQE